MGCSKDGRKLNWLHKALQEKKLRQSCRCGAGYLRMTAEAKMPNRRHVPKGRRRLKRIDLEGTISTVWVCFSRSSQRPLTRLSIILSQLLSQFLTPSTQRRHGALTHDGGTQFETIRVAHLGRAIPSFCIFDCSVVRFSPNRAAAPAAPPITQFVCRSTDRMCSRSASASVASSLGAPSQPISSRPMELAIGDRTITTPLVR